MPYQTNKPQPNDDLDVSVTDIQQNFLIANTVMDVDHYPFNDLSANKGFHKIVTSPDQGSAPAVTINAQLFGWAQTANIGTIQYSKRSTTIADPNPVPSPITYIQSPAAAIIMNNGDLTNVIDLTGITLGIFTLQILCFNSTVLSGFGINVMWNGTTMTFFPNNFPLIAIQGTGPDVNILKIKANNVLLIGAQVFWTLIPYRLQ